MRKACATSSLSNKAKIVTINVDMYPNFADKFMVMCLPTFIMYRNGEKVKTLAGIQKKEYLLALLQNL